MRDTFVRLELLASAFGCVLERTSRQHEGQRLRYELWDQDGSSWLCTDLQEVRSHLEDEIRRLRGR